MERSRSAAAARQQVHFWIPTQQQALWERWKQIAQEHHLSLRDWVQARLQQLEGMEALGTPEGRTWVQGLVQGRRQGWMMAQLEWSFGPGGVGSVNREELEAWMRQYPQDWDDVALWLSQQAWFPRFQAWWGRPVPAPRPYRRQ